MKPHRSDATEANVTIPEIKIEEAAVELDFRLNEADSALRTIENAQEVPQEIFDMEFSY